MGIPERLVEIREKNGYTRKRLSDELGRPYRTITKYETGEREPGHSYIVEIARKFGVSTDYILGVSDLMTTSGKDAYQTAESAQVDEQPDADSLRSTLLHNFDQLNQEGQERLVETSDDMVSSGKYIKSNTDKLGKEKNA